MSEETPPAEATKRRVLPFLPRPGAPKTKPLPKPTLELLPHTKTDELRQKDPDLKMALTPQEVSLYAYGKDVYAVLVLGPIEHTLFLEKFEGSDQAPVPVKVITCLSNGHR